MTTSRPGLCRRVFADLVLVLSLSGLSQLQAQPTIVSVSPTNGATGVATSSQVVFTFSTAMSTYSQAIFTNSAGSYLPVTPAWSAGNTVLTCTPISPFPASSLVQWYVAGFDAAFNPLTGTTSGSFTTGTGGGTGGAGTNASTTFSVSKIYLFNQTSTASPNPATPNPCEFGASTGLMSNRTATTITVTLPTTGVSNLTDNILTPQEWYFVGFNTNQTTFESTFPQGLYTFNVSATTSNQTLAVNLPASMPQPNAPHLTNYTAAQAINSAASFSLGWDPFTGGAGGSNFVFLTIIHAGTNVFQTGSLTTTNALPGTSVAVNIPANTLPAGSTFNGSLGFYHTLLVTNNASNISVSYRASFTQFALATTGGASGPLNFVNPRLSGSTLSFDVSCSAGQTFTILSSSDLTLPPAQWTLLLTTNSSGTTVHFVDSRPATSGAMFYRVRNGT